MRTSSNIYYRDMIYYRDHIMKYRVELYGKIEKDGRSY